MNHYKARQIQNGPHAGKWHYTCLNDREEQAYPTGVCGWFRICPDCKGRITNMSGLFVCEVPEEQGGPHCPTCRGRGSVTIPEEECCQGHDSPEAAYAHEKERLLRGLSIRGAKQEQWPKTKCAVRDCQCEATHLADLRDGWHHYELCERHATRDVVATLFEVGETWSS